METARCDERGRVVLPKELRDEFGEEYVIVRLPGEILFKPIPKGDPLRALREEGKKLPKDMSVADLKRQARELALEEVLEEEEEREELRRKAKDRQ
ncbi:MAG: hypothetical protein HYW25_01305 [Candidatus Aenigmarchaeota archaeon]|nr:hypothetical protein [Candidatus Aenigmarchaeota archaeon]